MKHYLGSVYDSNSWRAITDERVEATNLGTACNKLVKVFLEKFDDVRIKGLSIKVERIGNGILEKLGK